MKFIKMLGLMAVAAAAMMAFAGVASADTVTSSTGETPTIHATNEGGHVSLHGSNGVTIECASTVEGAVESHGAGQSVIGLLTLLSFTNCTNEYIVHVESKGSLTANATSGGNAGLSSTGAKVTATAKTIFGTISCTYTTNGTSLGTLTSSGTTGGTATLDISATIPRTGGSSLCGSTGVWTGNYIVNHPHDLVIHNS